jgi:hypothetical protein
MTVINLKTQYYKKISIIAIVALVVFSFAGISSETKNNEKEL